MRCLLALSLVCAILGCSGDDMIAEPPIQKTTIDEPVDVPARVAYNYADVKTNNAARAILQGFIDGTPAPDGLNKVSAKALICGPALWKMIEANAPKELLDAKPATFMIPDSANQTFIKLESHMFKTDAEKTAFWKLVLENQSHEGKPTIRKAKPEELDYYWSYVPYDAIEEPFFAIDAGSEVFLVDFVEEGASQKIFFIDLYQPSILAPAAPKS